MAIKPKRIDPEKARLAARGQWVGSARGVATSPHSQPVVSGWTVSNESTTSSASSDDGQVRRQQGISRWQGLHSRNGGDGRNDSASTVSLVSSQIPKSEADSSVSDPELYRAARQRTVQLLFPEGETAGSRRCVEKRDTADGGGSTGDTKRFASFLGTARFADPEPAKGGAAVLDSVTAEGGREDVTNLSMSSCREGARNRGGDSPVVPVETPLVVLEALQGLGASMGSETGRDFDRLLEIFAEESKVDESRAEDPTLSSVDAALMGGDDDTEQSDVKYRMFAEPPRTFSELQERVLLSLYDAHQEGDEDEDGSPTASNKYFIATDHLNEAFTLAALGAYKDSSLPRLHAGASATSLTSFPEGGTSSASAPCTFGAPLSLMDVVMAERARLNAKTALERQQEEGVSRLQRPGLDALFTADGDLLATAAEQSLERFHLSVRVLERAAANRRVIDELGNFLFAHHKLFLQGGSSGGVSSSIREYAHEAFTVYELYSNSVSNFLLQLLRRQVPSFSMEEFVLALYDIDLADNGTNPYADGGGDGSRDTCPIHCRSIDVLSYGAWRLLQSISSFDGFCGFMDDFIAEVYGVEIVVGPEENEVGDRASRRNSATEVPPLPREATSEVVAGAGARGIRALLAKSDETAKRQIEAHRAEGGANTSDNNFFTRSSFVARKFSPAKTSQVPKGPTMRSDSLPVARVAGPNNSISLSGSSFVPAPPSTPPSCAPSSQGVVLGSNQSFQRFHRRRPDAVPGRVLPPLEQASEREEPLTPDPSRREEMEDSRQEQLEQTFAHVETDVKPSLTPPRKAGGSSASGVGGQRVRSVGARSRSTTQNLREGAGKLANARRKKASVTCQKPGVRD